MKRILVLLCLVGYGGLAQATLFLEPYAGYNLSGNYAEDRGPGTGLFSTVAVGTDSGKLQDGFSWGGKLGYTSDTLFIGGDYQTNTSRFTANQNKDALGFDGLKPTFTSIGVMLGLRFGAFRLWAIDLLSDKVSFDGVTGKKYDYSGNGGGFKVGVGLLLYSHINFNVEYVSHMFSKLETSGQTISLPGTYDDHAGNTVGVGKLESSSVLMSLSFPFGF